MLSSLRGGARVRPRPRRFRGSPGIALGVAARTGRGSSSPSCALAAQAAPAGSSPSSGVLPSRVCRVRRVAAAPPTAVAQFTRLAGLGHDPREDGGHWQGVSCTDKKQTMKTNLPRRTCRCPCRPFHLFRTVTADGHTAADGCLGDRQRGVSQANEKKTQQSKLKKNSPAVPAAAFAGRSTAAALFV